MKKTLACLLALMMLASFVLASCGDEIASSSDEATSAEQSGDASSSAGTSSGDTSKGEEEIEKITPEYCTVISTGASYTASTAADGAYADSYGKELTDGQFAGRTEVGYGDEKFSGYATGGSALAIIIDLGEVKEKIYRFEVDYLNTNQAGIAAPGGMSIQVSEDNEKWTRVGSLRKPTDAAMDTTQTAYYEHGQYLTARYIKFSISPGSAWIFLDELMVCADVEGENFNAAYLEQLSAQYEKDSVTATDREALLASVRGDAIDRSLACNLISANRKYSTSIASHKDYKDSGTMLTDGVLSHYFEGGTWVGFDAAETVDVTIDLAKVRTDLAEFEVSVYINAQTGLLAPLNVAVSVSEDNKTFTEIGRLYGPSDTTQTNYTFRLCMATAVKGRYVRFSFASAGGSLFLMEECAVYAYGEEEPGLILYPEVELEKAPATEWGASESDYTKVQNLLLGRTQQITVCDSVTADMITNNTPVTSKLLTDGNYAGANENNIHGGKYFKFSRGGSRDIIYDLEHLSEIQSVKMSFLNYTDWAVLVPEGIYIYLSDDGDTWYEVEEVVTTTDKDQCAVQYEVTFDKPYAARYVAFSFNVGAWSAADELEVIGTKKVSTNAIRLKDSGVRSLKLVPNGYQPQDENLLNGAGDIVLLYNGQSYNNTVESTLPYVAYIDEDGKMKDTMFDGFLYLLTGKFPSGAAGHQGSTMADWTWYLNDLFAKGENIDALNTVGGQVNKELGLNKKYNFYVAMYIPHASVTNFGDVDGDGVSENFTNMADRLKAIDWYMDEFYKRFNEAGYENVQFGGFYWYCESISTYDDDTMFDLVRGVSDRVHARGEQFFWIPYFTAAGYSRWASFGFDVACLQPNYAFNGSVLENRLPEAAAMMRRYGLCTEMEIDDAALTNQVFYQKYMGYLKYGITEGYMKGAIHMYYQGTNVFGAAAVSEDPKNRLIYDYTYQFIKETLKLAPDARDAMSFTCEADKPFVSTLAPEAEKNVSYTVSISPAHGTVTINADGTFVYYPDKGYTGTDTFSYCISEQLGYSAPCEVTITVE